MTLLRPSIRLTVAAALVIASLATPASAQDRTDVVTLANGDRITGEVIRMDRAMLEFKTDDAGTLYLEWDKLASLVATRLVEVITTDGRRFLGTLVAAGSNSIGVASTEGTMALAMLDVTIITPIGRSFWARFDGSIDAGFSYTRSSGVAQTNLNWDTVYRRPGFQARLTASTTQTKQDDGSRDDRSTIELTYLRYAWQKWFLAAVGTFENNESLGLELRSQAGAAFGPRLIRGRRMEMVAGGGLAVNKERGVDVEPTENVEGLFVFQMSYFTYDRPKTNLDVGLQYYPSFSDFGRNRIQLDASVKRELWKDFYAGITLYDSFDSRPPNPDADRNDVGVVASLGWSY